MYMCIYMYLHMRMLITHSKQKTTISRYYINAPGTLVKKSLTEVC